MLAEPMQERPDTDMTPLSIAFTNPLANDFFQRRLDAVRGLAFRFDSGRKELPSVVIGTENIFDSSRAVCVVSISRLSALEGVFSPLSPTVGLPLSAR